jgi:hypothetical protein
LPPGAKILKTDKTRRSTKNQKKRQHRAEAPPEGSTGFSERRARPAAADHGSAGYPAARLLADRRSEFPLRGLPRASAYKLFGINFLGAFLLRKSRAFRFNRLRGTGAPPPNPRWGAERPPSPPTTGLYAPPPGDFRAPPSLLYTDSKGGS